MDKTGTPPGASGRSPLGSPRKRGQGWSGQRRLHRAVVLGAGIAGLAAARVLAHYADEVVVVDRDDAGPRPQGRKGTPQDQHTHVLLSGGLNAFEEQFPGVAAELLDAGAPHGDALGNSRVHVGGHRFRQGSSGLTLLSVSRPVLESVLRHRVEHLPGVRMIGGLEGIGLLLDSSGNMVVGALVAHGVRGGATESLEANLVVVATGRGTRLNDWLEANGMPPITLHTVPVGLSYTTARFRLRDGVLGSDVSMACGPTPDRPRGGVLSLIEGGQTLVTLTGVGGDEAPLALDGFRAFARDVALEDLAEALDGAEPLSDPVRYRHPSSIRRHFERAPLPEGLLIVGDALCTLNPAYGQGMTVAAQQAGILAAALAEPGRLRTRAVQRKVARTADVAWSLSRGPDLMFDGGTDHPSPVDRIRARYIGRIQARAAVDAHVGAAFLRVTSLVDPPHALFGPRLMGRVLKGN